MPPADDDTCRSEGCPRARTRHSVFCDEHHRGHLIAVGLVAATPPDPAAALLEQTRRILRGFGAGAITLDELAGALFDAFHHAALRGLADRLTPSFDALPPDVLAALHSYVVSHPEPRLFHPLPPTGDDRRRTEAAARDARDRLLRELSHRSLPG